MPKKLFFILTVLIACSLLPAAPKRSAHTEVELVSEVKSIQAGTPFWVALRMKMDTDWHTYWKNPGDSGLATSIEWDLPAAFTASPIHWPVPERFESGGIVTYGYTDEVLLLTQVTPPKNLAAGQKMTIKARAQWLECKDLCLPGNADLQLQLPTRDGPTLANEEWHDTFEKVREQWAEVDNKTWTPSAYSEADHITLVLSSTDTPTKIKQAYFYSIDAQIDPGSPQEFTTQGNQLFLKLKQSPLDTDNSRLPGIVHIQTDSSSTYLSIEPPLIDGPSPIKPVFDKKTEITLSILGLAFLGGLILNLMPCVFPILGLKIMSFVNRAGEDRQKIVLHGLLFTIGILVSFWVLSGILIALRAGGQELGWGFQLQEPGFVFILTLVLFIFALNMSGVFEIGQYATGIGSKLTDKKGLTGSFFSGVLATVVATPCSAPFLAPALGVALTFSPLESIVTFTVIGLGLSFPYLIFSYFPNLLKLLPQPGMWMENVRKLMAFLLYASAGYLLWVLTGQVSESRLLNIIIGLVMVALACWLYGRWATPDQKSTTRHCTQVGVFILILSALYLSYSKEPVQWERWSPEKVTALRAEGRPIYVDFTAKWCATCQVNKRLVFSSKEVLEAFKQKGVVLLKADWTRKDPLITSTLAEFGRSAVPFNILYIPGQEDPVVLPELLTPGIVLEALEAIP